MIIFLLLLIVALNACANVLAKLGSSKITGDIIGFKAIASTLVNPYIMASITCFGAAFLVYSFLLSKLKLSVSYPIVTSLTFLVVILFSALFFKEPIRVMQFVGMGIILIGIWFLFFSR